MLPRVKIKFENGNLGLVSPSPDGLLGIVCTGADVSTTFETGKAYKLNSLSSLNDLGITDDNNPAIVKIVTDFYNEAETGTEVWLMAFPDTVKMSEMVDKTEDKAKKLITSVDGKLRGVIVSRTPDGSYSPTVTDGLDDDVTLAISNAQALGEWATTQKFAPLFFIIEGYAFSGDPADLNDLTDGTDDNRVSVFIGDTEVDSDSAAMGVIAGRIASIPVERNIARVKTGALHPTATYIADKKTEDADVAGLNDKGYITFRTFVGRAGYFFNDDFTATDSKDDYSHLTARRTIDKAYRIAYDTLIDFLLDDVPINGDGTIQHAIVKNWEAQVENAIQNSMTVNGELSVDITDQNDKGVKCFIDPTQNIVSSSKVLINVSVRPFGYPRFIDVNLGFETIS